MAHALKTKIPAPKLYRCKANFHQIGDVVTVFAYFDYPEWSNVILVERTRTADGMDNWIVTPQGKGKLAPKKGKK